MTVDEELTASALSAENVQRLLGGKIEGEPEPGTLAHQVWEYGNCYCRTADRPE